MKRGLGGGESASRRPSVAHGGGRRRAELLAKLEKSKPFLNLRSMLNKKNVIVRDLRETLKAHGIQAGDDVAATED
eukprot:1207120-Prymnesium_polylepis.1